MAPIKFEENIREKLQERELTPSAASWDKLATQLESTPQKKKSTFLWMAVAAAVVGVLLAITLFTNTSEPSFENQLVEETTETKENLEITPTTNKELLITSEESKKATLTTSEDDKTLVKNTTIALGEKDEDRLSEKKGKKETATSFVKSTEEITGIQSTKNAVAIEEQENSRYQTPLPETLNQTDYITNKIDEVVASVKENNNISPAEIDALLAKAQRDIATRRILNSDSQKVDAMALLQDVETELEQSFRDKVFDALGDGFSKVRTAVAERNN